MIEWDRAGLQAIDAGMAKALELTAEGIRDDVREAQVVPRDTGNLQNEAFGIDRLKSSQGVVSLTFNTPYARRMYFHPEYNFNKKENPNAQGMWMRHWMPGGKFEKRAAEMFAAIMRRYI